MNETQREQFDAIIRKARINPDTANELLDLIEQVAFTAFVNGVRVAQENPV